MATIQEQFMSIKKEYPDALLLFRCGDFYEIYNEDADNASKVLKITLTTRGDGLHMCGFPQHALDSYLPKLVRAGYRVAICDPLEAPKKEGQATEQKKPEKPDFVKNYEANTKQLQLSLFDALPSEDVIRYRDDVAKELLARNYKECYPADAANAANELVKALYGFDLNKPK